MEGRRDKERKRERAMRVLAGAIVGVDVGGWVGSGGAGAKEESWEDAEEWEVETVGSGGDDDFIESVLLP